MRSYKLLLGLIILCFSCKPQKKEEVHHPYIPVDSMPTEGIIITEIDGFDVNQVNLRESISSNKFFCSLEKGDKVKIIEKQGEYYQVESIKNKNCKGYCMIGFVKTDNSY
jgi:hypothetical protein